MLILECKGFSEFQVKLIVDISDVNKMPKTKPNHKKNYFQPGVMVGVLILEKKSGEFLLIIFKRKIEFDWL